MTAFPVCSMNVRRLGMVVLYELYLCMVYVLLDWCACTLLVTKFILLAFTIAAVVLCL